MHHVCAYGVGQAAIIEHWRFSLRKNRKLVVTNLPPGSTTDDILCMVCGRWLDRTWAYVPVPRAGLNVEASDAAGGDMVWKLQMTCGLRRQVQPLLVGVQGLQARFFIPKDQGENVFVILARIDDSGTIVFAERDVSVGTEVTFDMSKLPSKLQHDTVEPGKKHA